MKVTVKPTLNPQLSEYFTELTGISQAEVDEEGVGLAEALRQFELFCAPPNPPALLTHPRFVSFPTPTPPQRRGTFFLWSFFPEVSWGV